jgi:putative peptidoglycan lipid II flippase
LVLVDAAAYAVGAVISYLQLSRQLGGLAGRRLLRFGMRIAVVVGVSAGLAWLAREGIHRVLEGTDKLTVLAHLGVIGLVGAGSYLVLARLIRLEEVDEVTRLLTGRFVRRR